MTPLAAGGVESAALSDGSLADEVRTRKHTAATTLGVSLDEAAAEIASWS